MKLKNLKDFSVMLQYYVCKYKHIAVADFSGSGIQSKARLHQ